jgi:chromosome segregation protein
MRLKKLEIKGFKSFADKTIIHFNENITGIVGPNGCGKSNVVDSIRWVLGEQKTSQLRLEKMDNVLFNGCKTRKATSLAEVSLTFDNTKNILATDFQEVTITRKLFRTGESEYRINNVSCRLKDIQNLFIDSGIGSDSYAIIELGMVDEILQNRDNSRRKLFEQASSITKYKIRKRESLQKLKSTEENLERLQDLLAEIESNIKTLETQAKRAERYNQIKDEYKVIALDIIKYQVKNYKENYNTVFNQKKVEWDKKEGFEKEIIVKETALQTSKLELLEREKNLTEIQKKFNELVGGLGKNENERNILKEQIANFDKLNQEILNQNEQMEKEISEINVSIKALEDELQKINSDGSKTKELLDKKKAEIAKIEASFNENKDILEKDKKAFSEIQTLVYQLDKERSILQNQISQLTIQKENFEQSLKKITEESKNTTQSHKELEKEKIKLETILEKLKEDELKLSQQLEENQNAITEQKNQILNWQRKLDSKRNEYNLLKSMIDNLEGYPESIKHLKRNVPSFQDKMVFSDLIDCADEYKSTVEILISHIANYFVVDGFDEGQNAIASLSKSQAGKSGFFVMEWIKSLPKPGFEIIPELVSALEVIKVEDKYKPLISHLFSNTYIVPENSNFDILPYKGKELRFIYQDLGKIIDSKSMYGGAKSLFDGAQVGRNKNVANLKTEIEGLEKNLQKNDKELHKLLERVDYLKNLSRTKEIEETSKSLKIAEDAFSKSQFIIEQSNINTKQFETEIIKKELELNDLTEKLKQTESQYSTHFKAFEDLKIKNESNSASFQTFLDTFNNEKNELSKIEANFNIEQNLIAQKAQQLTFFNEKMLQLKKQLEANQAKLSDNKSSEKDKIEQLSKIELHILENYNDKDSFNKEIETAEKTYYQLRGEILEKEEDLKQVQTKKNQLIELIQGFENRIQEMRLELQSIKERLKIEFSQELDTLLNSDLEVKTPLEELEQKQNHIKKRLETYGEINPMAIESYREVKERYDFLVTQKNDILESKENLINTIKEIDVTAKERFLDSFYKVRENFIKTFRILFTEDDDCDLILVDEQNPIDSDIEIIAKPKGKKPLTINQLSGGEKTLTATALLFSLYLLKPAPFCIFDEVDAPLDDTNIAKFNKIIDEFSKNSQFIIVTHNKQTMASVEVLYGVTMIEQGVSKLVPVDFRALETA